MKTKRYSPVLAIVAIGMAMLACVPGGGGTQAPPASPPVEGKTPVAVAPVGAGAVTTLEGIESAVVLIEAEGTKIPDPMTFAPNARWRGTGFLIDPSGVIVTNNHVVTGAGRLTVRVGGEQEGRPARVLGVSECSDLAVIDIEGDDYPYLRWYDGQIDVGLQVYAAGFPLSWGDDEYTMTSGIISKADANGESSWASVGSVLEHDATINPGNSGGPLVTADGQVVGVNYRGDFEHNRYFAIGREEALPVIEQLREGEDVNSIGIDGWSFADPEAGVAGIWISSVAAGSPADKAGIAAGDILSSLGGIYLATDGTMQQYCGVLKSHAPDDTLDLEVLRIATGEGLVGQLNGRELAFAYVLEGVSDDTTGGASTTASGYLDVSDAYSSIAVEIPAAWADTDGSAWYLDNEVLGAAILAAPDLDAYLNTWAAPGMSFKVSDDLATLGGYVQVLDAWRPTYAAACKLDGRYDYNDGFYRGKMDLFTNCGGPGGASAMVLSAVPTDNSQAFIVVLEMQWLTPEEEEYAVHALDTFRVIGTLP